MQGSKLAAVCEDCLFPIMESQFIFLSLKSSHSVKEGQAYFSIVPRLSISFFVVIRWVNCHSCLYIVQISAACEKTRVLMIFLKNKSDSYRLSFPR